MEVADLSSSSLQEKLDTAPSRDEVPLTQRRRKSAIAKMDVSHLLLTPVNASSDSFLFNNNRHHNVTTVSDSDDDDSANDDDSCKRVASTSINSTDDAVEWLSDLSQNCTTSTGQPKENSWLCTVCSTYISGLFIY